MPAQQLSNYVQTKLATACTNVATVLTLVSVSGLPIVGNFMLRIDDPAPATTFEIVEGTSVNVGASQVTVTRAQEGTTGIAHAADALVGNAITAAMLQRSFAMGTLPGGYAQVTATQGGIVGAYVDLAGLTVTVTPINGSRRVQVSAQFAMSSTVANDVFSVQLMEGATVLQITQAPMSISGLAFMAELSVILTPSAGAHTYKLQGARLSGTGTLTLQAAGTFPSYILAEDIGT